MKQVQSLPDRTAFTGLILAGGQGRRMGGADKGWLPYQGQALIERVLARLQAQVGQVLISANRNTARYAKLGWPVLADAPEEAGAGPLAGVLAGLRACTSPWMLVVPCDTPALPLDLLARLWLAGESAPAMALTASGPQPACALWPRQALPQLEHAFAAGQRSLGLALAALGVRSAYFDDDAAFVNTNSPGDLR